MRKLSGSAKKNNLNLTNSLNIPTNDKLSSKEIANAVNTAFLEPLQGHRPLDSSAGNLPVEELNEILKVPSHRVSNILLQLNKYKAPNPDGLSNWLLKEYAEILAEPVTNILNTSFRDQ